MARSQVSVFIFLRRIFIFLSLNLLVKFEEKEMNIAMKQEEAKRHEEMRIAEE